MAPGRTDWMVPVEVILARLDSMDPSSATADAAELRRIVDAARAVAARLTAAFGDAGPLEGGGAEAAAWAGLQAGRLIDDAAAALDPVHESMSGAAADLAATRSLRERVFLGSVLSDGGPREAERRAETARLFDGVYNVPMGSRGAGVHDVDAGSRAHGADALAGAPGAVGRGASVPAPAAAAPFGTSPGSPAVAGSVVPDAVSAQSAAGPEAPVAAMPPPTGGSGSAPIPAVPGAGPSGGPAGPAAPGAPGGGGPFGVPTAGAGGGGAGPAAPSAAGRARPAPSPAMPMPGVTGAVRPPAPGTAGGASGASGARAASPSAVARPAVVNPGGLAGASTGRSGSSFLPPGAARGGAREDDTRRRPDYLVTSREGAGLIGALPDATPAVLGERAPAPPEIADDEQELDPTL
ncbi:MAG: hypothetical protein QM774_02850 [Gordonia sp. (in: high G+C Gram-positive bacteria)]|uniref:hypothetical protein n=1 Tax=Gordonia sp. (in: high G+C Gram-positive bacteria) TaxID=84139 RepID=UPI0039E641F3